MLSLHPQHITDLFVGIDDLVPEPPANPLGGRPAVLTNSELITLLVWNTLVLHQKTIKDLHTFTSFYLHAEFPELPKYEGFLAHCHRVTPVMFSLKAPVISELSLRTWRYSNKILRLNWAATTTKTGIMARTIRAILQLI